MKALRLAPGPRVHFLGNLPDFGRDMLGFFVNCARESLESTYQTIFNPSEL